MCNGLCSIICHFDHFFELHIIMNGREVLFFKLRGKNRDVGQIQRVKQDKLRDFRSQNFGQNRELK
jgi:hypothetical protein